MLLHCLLLQASAEILECCNFHRIQLTLDSLW